MGLAADTPASQRMRMQRTAGTEPELALRRRLHARGLRYRVNRKPISTVRRTADIVFGPARVAVFVHGCFWHSCPSHATAPKTNADFWRTKLARNRERDSQTAALLEQHGWLTMIVWECADMDEAANQVAREVTIRRPR